MGKIENLIQDLSEKKGVKVITISLLLIYFFITIYNVFLINLERF